MPAGALHSEALELALGEVVAEYRRQYALEIAEARATIAELVVHVAELQARVAEFEHEARSALEAAAAATLAGLRQPADGRSVTVEDLRPMVLETVGRAVDAMPPAQPGPAGLLPLVVEWVDGVHYRADVVTCDGSTWQAQRDTGRRPGDGDDWLCLAAGGRDGVDGADGRSPRFLGAWSADGAYRALDVVMVNGASFAAIVDDPGPCPGENWRLVAARGKAGKPGEGRPGTPGRSVTAAELEELAGPLLERIVSRMLASRGIT